VGAPTYLPSKFKSNSWVGLGQPDDLENKRERRAREGPQAGSKSHADWNPGINPLPSYSLVCHRIGRPMVSEVLL